ncbi:hypothetical protein [Mycoplasma tauri]|uniref:hypothetical protein n=1 Tax=Mycoplasma tauri TaxID=547987 RepID=UPI001CBAEBDB|nr:hypothetical protein [Mycoplasma tauri]MBZ4226629.1 hypothetical protein [Mycoplasma tauri]
MFNFNYKPEQGYEDLWKHEKSFKTVFIITLVSFLIMALFYYSIGILEASYNGAIKEFIQKNIEKSNVDNGHKSELFRQSEQLFYFGIATRFIIGSLILGFGIAMLISIIFGYKRKNFSKIIKWPNTVYFVLSFYLFYIAISTLFAGNFTDSGVPKYNDFKVAYSVITVIGAIVLFISYFIFARKYTVIKTLYLNIEKAIEAKKQMEENPELLEFYKNIEQAFNGLVASSEQAEYNNETTSNQFNNSNEQEPKNKSKRDEYFEKMMLLPNEKLYAFAEKLYISGYENMEKETLANLILDIFEKQERDKEVNKNLNNDEIVVEPKESIDQASNNDKDDKNFEVK